MDFKTNCIALYNEMRWKENKTVKEAQICRDFRVFITTKFQDNDTRMTLNAVDRGDYDPEKKTLNPTLIPSMPSEAPQLSQQSHTNSPNTSGQSGNAVEVEVSPDIFLTIPNGLETEVTMTGGNAYEVSGTFEVSGVGHVEHLGMSDISAKETIGFQMALTPDNNKIFDATAEPKKRGRKPKDKNAL